MEENSAGCSAWSSNPGFNGATAMKPWKRLVGQMTWLAGVLLQWGHGDEAVEELAHRAKTIADDRGFNGATAMKPWKRAAYRRSMRRCEDLLQWGHGDEAVEEIADRIAVPGIELASMGPRR